MITCPWCGTNQDASQPACRNCGGPLPATDISRLRHSAPVEEPLPVPPPPPRPIAANYAWRLMTGDGWSIAAFVFALLGAIFIVIGVGLTIGIITAFIGIPFLFLGLALLAAGGAILYWRHNEMQKIADVLRSGEVVEGQVTSVDVNYSVRVNGRSPWTIRYCFDLGGQLHEGQVTTLNQPGPALQPGRKACVLYLPQAPEKNSLYPHP